MAWLDSHPPARQQFWVGRREPYAGAIVIHTAESAPDEIGPDDGAENVAQFIRGRSGPGSYHYIVDSDSSVQLVELGNEAFHVRGGGNAWSVGISFATQAHRWADLPAHWAPAAVIRAADIAAAVGRETGVPTPARRLTKAEFEARRPGFISHAEVDPARRTDPGKLFSWDGFFDAYSRATATVAPGKPYPTVVGDAPLATGDEGPGVRTLQHILDAHHSAGLIVDGDYGPLTEAAVRSAQAAGERTMTGIWRPTDSTAEWELLVAGHQEIADTVEAAIGDVDAAIRHVASIKAGLTSTR